MRPPWLVLALLALLSLSAAEDGQATSNGAYVIDRIDIFSPGNIIIMWRVLPSSCEVPGNIINVIR